MAINKIFITAEQLMQDSVELARQILESDFRPDYIVGVWRGGTPVGIAVQETLDFFGVETDHISIRTSSYRGIEKQRSRVRVHGLSYLTKQIDADNSLLIVDDVFDTGSSVQAIVEKIHGRARKNAPDNIKVATTYYKPTKNKTKMTPDFFVHETAEWLVFPHEVDGLTREEIRAHKPYLNQVIDALDGQLAPVKMADSD